MLTPIFVHIRSDPFRMVRRWEICKLCLKFEPLKSEMKLQVVRFSHCFSLLFGVLKVIYLQVKIENTIAIILELYHFIPFRDERTRTHFQRFLIYRIKIDTE